MALSHGIIKIFFISIIIKIIYFAFAYSSGNLEVVSFESYEKSLRKNDAIWYQDIAENGYDSITSYEELAGGVFNGKLIQCNWAFFPVYPAMLAGLTFLLKCELNDSALIISYIFSTACFIGLFLFCCIFLKNNEQAFYISLCLMLFPFHYYYSMFYTESIFLTFTIYGFICVYKKQYLILFFLLILLTLVRPNGIVIAFAMYLFYLEQNNILSFLKVDWEKLFSKQPIIVSAIFLTAPATLIAYCIYQYYKTGYFLAFSIAQTGWGKKPSNPFSVLYEYDSNDTLNYLYSTYTILAMLVALYGIKKLPLSLNILIWTSILIPLSSGSVLSMQRFISVIFPLFIIVAYNLYKSNYKYFILTCLFGLQLFSFYYWFNFSPLGF